MAVLGLSFIIGNGAAFAKTQKVSVTLNVQVRPYLQSRVRAENFSISRTEAKLKVKCTYRKMGSWFYRTLFSVTDPYQYEYRTLEQDFFTLDYGRNRRNLSFETPLIHKKTKRPWGFKNKGCSHTIELGFAYQFGQKEMSGHTSIPFDQSNSSQTNAEKLDRKFKGKILEVICQVHTVKTETHQGLCTSRLK